MSEPSRVEPPIPEEVRQKAADLAQPAAAHIDRAAARRELVALMIGVKSTDTVHTLVVRMLARIHELDRSG